MEFELPSPGVHVMTARNGCGKTTLLICLSRLKDKNSFKNNFHQNISNNVDSYGFSEITFKSNKNNSVTYTYRESSDSWRPTTKTVSTLSDFNYNEIITMLPLGERVYVQGEKIKGGKGRSARSASKELQTQMSEILESPKFKNLKKINTGETRGRRGAERRNTTAFLISYQKIIEGKQKLFFYSESSFSLGEIYTLNLLYQLKTIKKNSLIVIDELEVALHPRVQVNLLKYLQDKAKEKQLTVIISTHSSSLIKTADNLIYLNQDEFGKVDINYNCYPALALQEVAVEEDFQPDFVFFVEDSSAQVLLKELIRKYFQIKNKEVQPLWKVLPIGGYTEVLRFMKNSHQYLLNKSIGQFSFLDYDVIESKNELSKKGNKRSDEENEIYKLFTSQNEKIKYLDITPELGLWDWMNNNKNKVNSEINIQFPDSSIDIRKLIKNCKSFHPNKAKNPRAGAKKYTNWIFKEICELTNDSIARVKQRLYSAYVDDTYDYTENKGKLKNMFSPIFKK